MTAYTTITNALVAVGAKPFATTIQALRDNPLAIAEGDPTAPKIQGSAVARDFNNGLAVVTVAAGSIGIQQGQGFVAGTITTTSLTNVVAGRFTIKAYTGTLRFTWSHAGTGGFTSTLEVFKNNVLVQSYSTTSTTFILRTNDIAIVPGDVVEWRHRTSNAGGASQTSTSQPSANIAYVEQVAYRLNTEVLT